MKVQNSQVKSAAPQTEIENFDSAKNEVSIETLEAAKTPKEKATQDPSSISEKKLQAEVRATDLNKQLDSIKGKPSADSFLEQDNTYKTYN